MSAAPVLLVSHGAGKNSGGELVFMEALLALRQIAPDTPLIAVFPCQGPLLDEAAANGVKTYVVPLPRWADFHHSTRRGRSVVVTGRLTNAIVQAHHFLKRHRPSVVVTNTMTPPSFAVAARIRRIPHVWMIQEFGNIDHNLSFYLGYPRTIRLISRLSDSVVCCSKAVEGALRAQAPAIKARTIYYGMDVPELPIRPRSEGEALQAVLLGRFSESKGQAVAVEATALARAQGADIHLTLVGPAEKGELSRVQALAHELGIDAHVQYKPETANLVSVWKDAHVALMCSRNEAFGRVTVEAMKAGLPVCGTNSGGTPEIVSEGTSGFLSPPGDPSALASGLVRLASDEPLRVSLARGASESASRYSLHRYGEELFTTINSVMRVGGNKTGAIPNGSS